MEFRTSVELPHPTFKLHVGEQILFVGSCFADNLGKRFAEDLFDVCVNPNGVLYNPISVLHTIDSLPNDYAPQTAIITLGTNRVYVLKSSGEIVDNCEKRSASLFEERSLSIDECIVALSKSIASLQQRNPSIHIILTVSPIRYRKYGYHGSQLSKATLLLAADAVCQDPNIVYFPAYEILNDELRDYRFYAPDMLHPSQQTVDFICENFAKAFFSEQLHDFMAEWTPLKKALNHKPFHAESAEYQQFIEETNAKVEALKQRYNLKT